MAEAGLVPDALEPSLKKALRAWTGKTEKGRFRKVRHAETMRLAARLVAKHQAEGRPYRRALWAAAEELLPMAPEGLPVQEYAERIHGWLKGRGSVGHGERARAAELERVLGELEDVPTPPSTDDPAAGQ